jgi:hypothetical protein
VLRFCSDQERQIWHMWKLDHPAVRYDPNQDVDDGTGGRFPASVSRVAVEALGRLGRALRTQIDSAAISEDEAADLCNDMAEVQSAVEILRAA